MATFDSGFGLDAIRAYGEYRKEQLAARIRITRHEIHWRAIQPFGRPVFNRQYLLLKSAKVSFYLYIVKRSADLAPADTFDTVFVHKSSENGLRATRWLQWLMNKMPRFKTDASVTNAATDPHEAFCSFVESVLHDTRHYALTVDDLSPAAISSIVAYAQYLTTHLRSDNGAEAPQVFVSWAATSWGHCLQAMVVVEPGFDCAGFEGPRRFRLLQQLANANYRAG